MISTDVIALDIETCDNRGASFEYFRSDFRIFSLSLAWRTADRKLAQWFSVDSTEIDKKLKELEISQQPIVVHNLSFEYGVINPTYKLNWYKDTMRLAQLYDGGSEYWVKYEPTLEDEIAIANGEMTEKHLKAKGAAQVGLSLEACSRRFINDESIHSHKAEAHGYLREHYKLRSNFGGHLDKLPLDILERYNNSDTEVTLRLYEELIQRLTVELQFNPAPDERLYNDRARLMTTAYRQGIKIDREALFTYILQIEQEIKDIEEAFLVKFEHEIKQVQRIRWERHKKSFIDDPTVKRADTPLGRWASTMNGTHDISWKNFNVGSTLQLGLLFCDVLKIPAKFLTPKGAPSFKTTHMTQWGEGGKMLHRRKKRLIVLQQCVNTYIGSSTTGRIHPSCRVAGTKTNRVSGGQNG